MIKAAGQLVPLKVDAEKEGAELAKKYEVQGYPTILFIDATGEVFGSIGGYMPPAGFLESMQSVVDVYKVYPAAVEALKKDPNDGMANATMARVFGARHDVEKATESLKRAEAACYKSADLAKAYNAVGDAYQLTDKPKEAIPFFLKGIDVARSASDKAYSLVSVMFCYLALEDEANARKYAKALTELKDAPKEYVDMAKNVLGG